MCGEKDVPLRMLSTGEGSPPRVRGKADCYNVPKCGIGITPACAGKSFKLYHRISVPEDHPRVCGEKFSDISSMFMDEGSPPRVRGKGTHPHLASLQPRITPACAGKSRMWRQTAEGIGDHPRVCGEKKLFLHGLDSFGGSPPRVRGKAIVPNVEENARGITPACAGKSLGFRIFCSSEKDHPRVCGEKAVPA